MGGKSASKRASREAEQARADEQARQERIRQGTSRINLLFDGSRKDRGYRMKGAFEDDFFDAQRDRYIDYAMPQVEDQKREADRDLLFAMDRSGNLESSARADLSGELEKRAGLQRQKVRDDGLNFSTQARNNVESARNDLIAMLNATGDAEGAANSAVARATALSQPAAYSPIGNLFADFTGALGTQAAAERAYAYGGPRPTYNTGMFAPRAGAVTVT